nr:bifunctional precorrin-2 dehydrogenase/sirohydrochlorin ferrochelatase [uncultured Faecalimonas sp.]
MRYFPIFMDLEGKQILVVGAGKIALRRVQTLLQFGARIKVITKELPKEQQEAFALLVSEGKIELEERIFEEKDLTEELFFVLAATNVKQLNHEICMLCRERKILANTATDRTDCDFYFPAVAVQEELVVGITGDGSNHRKVAETAARIRNILEMEHEEKNQSRQQGE